MRKNRIILLVTFVLAIIAAILIITNSKSTFRKELKDFAIDDTTKVTRIFMVDKSNRSVDLERIENEKWRLNDKYTAQQESVDLLLKTMVNLAVMEPVSEAAHNTVVTLLASSSIKVEIYQEVYRIRLFNKIKLFPHEKLTKTYYVGHTTQNNIGTYMLMEGADKPFIVYMPGFRGFVASRYRTIEKDWRDHTMFNSRLQDIQSVSVEFPEDPEQSYIVTNNDDRFFELTSLVDNSNISQFDTLKVLKLITSFSKINFESLLNDMHPDRIDSLTSGPPFHIITLTKKSGDEQVVKTYHKPGKPGEINYKGEPVLWDRDRFYATLNDGQDFVLIQFYVFDKITRPLVYFIKD